MIKKNSSDGQLYQVSNEDEENAMPQSLEINLKELIEQSLISLENEYSTKVSDSDKVRLFEFRFETEDFEKIIAILNEIVETEWIDDRWRDKYTPNVLGIEVAFLKIGENQVMAQREKDFIDGNTAYFFEIEEPLVKIDRKSIAEQMNEVFNSKQIEYTFVDFGILEYEFDD